MIRNSVLRTGLVISAMILPVSVWAAVTPEMAAQLGGSKFTPVGAERAGNADGTIPEWTGGLTGVPAGVSGFVSGEKYPDPFADDKPIATITRDNLDKHRDKLTDGQIALLMRGPDERMVVYPSRRSCAYPQKQYDRIKRNAVNTRLTADGDGLVNAEGGFPFPFPQSGQELVWNHKGNFYGAPSWRALTSGFMVNGDGSFEETRIKEEITYFFLRDQDQKEGQDHIHFMTKVTTLAPARRKGNILLIQEPIDHTIHDRNGWLYLTALRRTLRGPDVEFDAPDPDAQGLLTIDQRFMFNGSLARYDWKILGKKEKYVAYNAYKLINTTDKTKEVGKSRLNPESVRYELHRVWVVEGTLKPDQRHIYQRRVLFIDEDSWYTVAAEFYDSQNKLWRTSESAVANFYDIPSCMPTVRVNWDLLDDKYYIEMWPEKWEFNVDFPASYFSPDGLRQGQR